MLAVPVSITNSLAAIDSSAQRVEMVDVKRASRTMGSMLTAPEKTTSKNAHRLLVNAARPIIAALRRTIIKIAERMANRRPFCLIRFR